MAKPTIAEINRTVLPYARKRFPAPGAREDDTQIATIQLLRLKLDPSVLVHHSPNGGKRSAREAARFKAMGTRAGWLDLVFIWEAESQVGTGEPPETTYAPRVAFIEMKAGRNGTTASQDDFMMHLNLLGIPHAVCRSAAEVLDQLEQWGVPMRSFK